MRVCIIESKLIQEHSTEVPIKSVITKGIFQLYTKYSDSVAQSFIVPPDLYLVLFCFDHKFVNIRKHTESALEDYQKENRNIKLEMMHSTHHQTIRFNDVSDFPRYIPGNQATVDEHVRLAYTEGIQ